MIEHLKYHWPLYALAVGIVIIVSSIVFIVTDAINRPHPIYDEGQRAYNVGVPAEANPYQGRYEGSKWLEGWIDGKEQDNRSKE